MNHGSDAASYWRAVPLDVVCRTLGVMPRKALRPHIWTLAEANKALPLVSRIVADMVDDFDSVARAGLARKRLEDAGLTPYDAQLASVLRRISRYVAGVESAMSELDRLGVEVCDPELGTVHFPTVHEDAPAFFVWRLGERTIKRWHRADEPWSSHRTMSTGAA